jgi:CheY-like chemotaxis protein
MTSPRPIRILLVEDDPGDVLLTQEALADSKLLHELEVINDGAAALERIARSAGPEGEPMPDLVLLDLNLPKVDGRGVLAQLKGDPATSHVPVVVLTTSDAAEDVSTSYGLHANAYVCKPVDFAAFHEVIRSIDDFFLTVVRLPTRS